MRKSIVPLMAGLLIVSILTAPSSNAHAQVITLPAQMNKGFSPLSIPAGGTARLHVSIFNPNGFPLTNASWTDNLVGVQPGLIIANPANIVNTCGGSVTAVAGATTLSLSGGTVPAQTGTTPGSCTVTITVTSTAVGNLINTIPSGELSASGGGKTISNMDPASATLHVGGAPTPTITKSFSSSTIWAGEISRLSIVISNNDSHITLTQASLTDNLPANVFLANPVSPTLTGCGGSASLNAASGGSSVALTNGTIAPSSTCTITVNVTSNVQGAYTNRIPASALQNQQGLTNGTEAIARLNVQEIGLSKRFSPGSLPAGGTTMLTITLQNPTSSAFTGASLLDTLPAPLTVVSLTGNSCGGTVSTTNTTIRLTGGTIPPGSPANPGTCVISVDVTVPAGTSSGTFRNTIPAGGLTTDQGVGNLRPGNANLIVTSTQMAGIKSFSPSTIDAGGNSRLRIDIFAPSDTDLTNVTLTDNLPAGVTVSNSTPPSLTGCGASPPLMLTAPTGATSISLTGGVIQAGQRCRIDVYVTSSTLGLYTNTISPANITNSENRTLTNDLTANLTVANAATTSIALVKGFNPLTVFGGSASTMSIELLNPGTVPLSGITFTDNMPNGMILANPVNFDVGTCGGTLTGAPGVSSFSYSGGSLPAAGVCTLTLSATMTVNGNLTNTIPASAVTTDNGVTNTDPAEATLTNLPGVSISKYFRSNQISPGSTSTLTITIQNTGNVALSGMGFSDSLPAGLKIAGGSAPSNNCGGTLTADAGTQLIQLKNGSLGPSASCKMSVNITGNKPGSYQNTIPAGAITTDSNTKVTNNLPATDTLVITGKTQRGGGNNNKKKSTPVANSFLIPVTGFAPGMVTKLNPSAHTVYDSTSLTLEIPVLHLDSPIVGVESKQGNWDVSWLQDQVGWLNGTAYPTWNGNSVLTGHVVNADGKPGLFYRLKSLGVGEYIFINNAGYRYTYEVVSNTLVPPNDVSVMQHQEKPFLTLITCDTYDKDTGTYLRRVVVGALLVDIRPIK